MVTLHRVSTAAFLRALTPPFPPSASGRPAIVCPRLLGTLRLRAGCIVSYGELAESVYGDDSEGGPEGPRYSLALAVWRLRKDGWPIVTHGWRGYSLGAG